MSMNTVKQLAASTGAEALAADGFDDPLFLDFLEDDLDPVFQDFLAHGGSLPDTFPVATLEMPDCPLPEPMLMTPRPTSAYAEAADGAAVGTLPTTDDVDSAFAAVMAGDFAVTPETAAAAAAAAALAAQSAPAAAATAATAKPKQKRRPKVAKTDEEKDEAYFEYRRKNTERARRSRLKKKLATLAAKNKLTPAEMERQLLEADRGRLARERADLLQQLCNRCTVDPYSLPSDVVDLVMRASSRV